jgi:two-component system cell cycle sensor histidine kinase/response regulator CckA
MSFRSHLARVGLVWQFAIAFCALALVAGAFLYSAVRTYARDTIQASSLALMSNARAAVFSKIDAALALPESMVKRHAALARLGQLPLNDEQRLSRFFLEQTSLEPVVDYLFFANEQGGIAGGGTQYGKLLLIFTKGMKTGIRAVERVDASGALLAHEKHPRIVDFDPRVRPWYVSAKRERRLTWAPPAPGTVTAPLTLALAYPAINSSGEFLGVFGGDVLLDSLGGYLESYRSGPNAHLMLLDSDGTLVANSSKAPLFSENNGEVRRLKADTVPQPLSREAVGLVRRVHESRVKSLSTLLHDDEGRGYYIDIAPYVRGPDIRWYLITVVPRSDFTGPLDALWSRFLLILLCGAVGTVGLSRVMAGWVTRPMRAISERVKQIAAGQFGRRVATRRQDEIGQLVHSFNDMSERLASTYQEIRQKNVALDAANRDLATLLERERVRRMEAEAEGRRARVLGEATAAMSSTQDFDGVLRALPRSLVHSFVDWAVVEVEAPGGTTRAAGAHRDPDKESLLSGLIEAYAVPMIRAESGASGLETGEPLHLPALSDEQVHSWCVDEDHAEALRRLGTGSSIIVSLVAREKRVGKLSLFSASQQRFEPADVGLAAELGRRAAMALDTARLYADLQHENAERRQAEAARGKTEDLLQGIVEKSSALIYVKDLDGRYLLVNRHMAEVIGIDARAVLGKTVFDVYSPEQARALAAFDQRVLAAGQALEGEEEVLRSEGVHTYITIKAPLTDASGRVYALCGISTDITARKRAEAALRRSEELLRQAQKMEAIGNLAGGVAHDFNNLLSVILGYSSLLMQDMEPSDARRADVEEIERAGRRATALTQQLLAFGRKQLLQPKIIKLSDIVAGVESMLRRLIGENIGLTVRASSELGCVRADPSQIEQILMNLAVNSRDAMPGGGKLLIETANVNLDQGHATHVGVAPGCHVMLAVTDDGIGMDRATQARIFEPFFTTKGVGKGTGLGLATVFGIVQQSGGSICLDSEPGKGTTFRIYFPRTDATKEAERDSHYPVLGALEGSETILLVEDEEQVRTLVRTILQRFGYNVIEAQTGGDALLLAEKHAGTIDLLLTDVIMPHISGPELAARLSELVMKVLYMSGYTEDAIVHQGVVDSGVALLQKPITPDALARKVREVLDSPPDLFTPRAPQG